MKTHYIFTILGMLLMATTSKQATAQTLTSGSITYEGMRKLDPSQIKIMINGDVVQPGSPSAPDVPDVATFSQQLLVSGTNGKEVREIPGAVIRTLEGAPGDGSVPKTVKLTPPFEEKNYLDLKENKYLQLLEIKKDSATNRYMTEEPYQKAIGWQESDKTRKIAGYTCRKATCQWKGETYTIWYTTELGFTYSPINGLVPPEGVVLQLEASGESFKATKIESKQIAEKEVKPVAEAQLVSLEEFKELRSKAMADFRQQMFSAPFPR